MLHCTKHLATLALTALLGILPSMADIVPQTDDPTNSDTYQGWVDNTDGHLTADDITGTTWTGTTLPTARFIYVNEANFPDENFRDYIINNLSFYSNGNIFPGRDGLISSGEILRISEINCHHRSIASMEGIGFFKSLTKLYCFSNNLSTIDITELSSLTSLRCYDNQLTQLDVTQNRELTELWCGVRGYGGNLLTTLDVSANDKLTSLECSYNYLTELDVSNLLSLRDLRCEHNLLKRIDVSINTDLIALYCNNNQLTEMILPEVFTNFTSLDCSFNQLSTLDLFNYTALSGLVCGNNHLTSLDLSNQSNLISLSCSNQYPICDALILSNTSIGVPLSENVIQDNIVRYSIDGVLGTFEKKIINGTGLYVSSSLSFTNINSILWREKGYGIQYKYDIECGSEKFIDTKMQVTILPNPYVVCGENNQGDGNFPDDNFRALMQTAEYDQDGDGRLSKAELTPIVELNVPNMDITTMQGIEYMKYLQTLDCSGNQLSAETDLPLVIDSNTYNPDLTSLNCSGNQLTGIDVSKSTKLQFLNCSGNRIAGALNANKSTLIELHCGNNELTGLTLPSTKTNLVKLTCKDNQLSTLSATGYTAMTLMDCSSNLLKTLTVAGNSALETFNCSNNQLTSLTLPTTKTALLDLNCNTNQLTTSALSTINQYTNLTSLNCGVNKLEELNLDGNTKLETLDCASQIDRSLVQLTLPNTTTLADVKCQENSLTEIDFSNNTGLTALDCSTNNLTALDLSANTALETLDYSNQTRTLEAESGLTTVDWDAQGNPIKDKFYFFRLDSKSDGSSQPIWSRMTATNYNNATSTFVPGNVFEWTGGGTVVEGTKGKNNAAGVGDVRPQNVVGDILVLTDVTETGNDASGTVTYIYNVNNDLDPDGSKGDFTLNWVTERDVVTEVTDLGVAQREPVAVEYHNLAGMVSDRPWQGVNIVVMHYSDGTVITHKMLH